MAISNMQQARQLRAGGGIMDLEPRQGFFLGKLVKKVTRPLKKIAKSPLGKAALLYAGTAGLGALGAGASGTGFTKAMFSPGNVLSNMKFGLGRLGLGSKFIGPPNPNKVGFFKSLIPGANFSGKNALIAAGIGATALPFLTGGGDEEEEIVETFEKTPGTIADIRLQSRMKDPSLDPFRIPERFAQRNYYLANGGVVGLANGGGAGEQQMVQALQAEYAKYRQQGGTMPFEQFVKMVMQQQQPQMAANGGRIGYAGGMNFSKAIRKEYAANVKQGYKGSIEDYITEFYGEEFLDPGMKEGGRIGYATAGPVMQEEVINEDTQEVVSNPDPLAELNMLSIEVFGKPYDMLNEKEQEALQMFMSQNPEEEVIDTDETMVEDRVMANSGGMIDYMSSANPMARSYIMEDEDIVNMYRPGGERQMAAEGGIMDLGGMEKDYRAEGGFVAIGGKEKADDVPARLSKNEFVFTADAVRNAGDGDIDKGSAVMQRMMDNLEQGGEISEESQGMNPAQEMFDTAQQLESRIG